MEGLADFKVTRREVNLVTGDGEPVNETVAPSSDDPKTDPAAGDPAKGTPTVADPEKKSSEGRPADEGKEPKTAVIETPTQGEPEKPKVTETPAAPAKEEKPVPDLNAILHQKTGGKFKTVDEVLAALAKEPVPAEPKYKDDYIKKAVDYYNATGNLKPYLEAFNTDYSKVSDEGMMKMKLREEYPNLSEKAFAKIYRERVINKYNLDPEDNDPDDVEIGKELMAADATKLREEASKRQQEFKMPDQPTPESTSQDKPAVDVQAENEKLKKIAESDPAVGELLTNKRLVYKHEGSDFNYEVAEPEKLTEMIYDDSKFWSLFKGADGKADLGKFLRVAAFATDEDGFMKAYGTNAKSIGKEEVLKKIKNTTPATGDAPQGEDTDNTPAGLLKAMAERGRKTTN